MPNEQTPLIQVVHVAPPRDRYPHHTIRRFCTIALVSVPLLVIAACLVSFVISGQNDVFGDSQFGAISALEDIQSTSDGFLPHPEWPSSQGLSYSEVVEIISQTPDAKQAREWSRYYASGPHLAGQNFTQAMWTKELWQSLGVESHIVPYETYINYPLGHRLALLEGDEVRYEASLEEDVLEEDPTTGLDDRIPTFHGYSASGNVTSQYVFVNYGTYQDYEDLREAGVDLKGKIALAKYGGIFRGLKVKRAEDLGMIGAVIYSDPGDDGESTELNGYAAYPDGPARNPSSVQRGSVQYLSTLPGDPTTPGYPSKPGVDRQDPHHSIPRIPSLPISYADALPLLQALNHHGPNASSFGNRWHTGGLYHKNVTYNIGPSAPNVTLHLVNEQNYTITPQWDTIGIINGSIANEAVIVGNHRDAWIAGGAGDPNSGSAALNEVVRSMSLALVKGWRPQRTIVFASWDGEEYGLLGSTEWVEEFLPWIKSSAVAYLNVDVGARGTHFTASGAPLLDETLISVTQNVQSPNQTVNGSSVYNLWDKKIRTIGSGSDFTAFQDHAGVPCLDIGFNSDDKVDPVYHYHSNYDSEAWMEKFGDPTFAYHVTIAKVLGLLAVRLSEQPVIPFKALDYALALERYVDKIAALAQASKIPKRQIIGRLRLLRRAVGSLRGAATSFDIRANVLALQAARPGSWRPEDRLELFLKTRIVNNKYKNLEKAFLYAPGLDGREWFKHIVFAPGLWTGYSGDTLPGLTEALQANDAEAFGKWASVSTSAIWSAYGMLQGGW